MNGAELSQLIGTTWEGKGELWLDPLGDEAIRYGCTARVDAGAVTYTWHHDGKKHEGRLSFAGERPTFVDSWHQQKHVECRTLADAWGLLALDYTYGAGEGPPWGWRIVLSRRPSGELVLQMTNVTPWGEEARAVRMVFGRES